MILKNVNVIIPEDSGRVEIQFNEDTPWSNLKTGKSWMFKAGWSSDGHSIPGPTKNLDRSTMAAVSHDFDCENYKTYEGRRIGDRDYFDNLRYLGEARHTAWRRYIAVSLRTYRLKLTGKFE